MKKIYTLFFLLLSGLTVFGNDVEKKVKVTSGGKLSTHFTTSEMNTIAKLTVQGIIDASDFVFIRDQLTELTELDISNTSIVTYEGTEGTMGPNLKYYPANELPAGAFFDIFQNKGKKSIKSVILPESIVSVGRYAFHFCDKLINIIIPESVTSIGDNAFLFCESLKQVILPRSLFSIGITSFSNCNSLSYIAIPRNVQRIGFGAFSNSNSLTTIDVDPENQYFSSKNGVLYDKKQTILIQYPSGKKDQQYEVPQTIVTIGKRAFEGTLLEFIELPVSVAYIDGYAFANSKLKTVDLPSTVIGLGIGVFADCKLITSAILPNTLQDLPNNLFSFCENLKVLSIPAVNNSIGNMAFYGCSRLNTISLPKSTSEIGFLAFANMTGLESIRVAKDNEYFKSVNDVLFDKNETLLIQYPIGKRDSEYVVPVSVSRISNQSFANSTHLTTVRLPGNLELIESSAFTYCTKLTAVSIPSTVKRIDDGAFSNCKLLKSVVLPETLQFISNSAFTFCGLTNITIPPSVNQVQDMAFYGCTQLQSTSLPVSIEVIGDRAFGACRGMSQLEVDPANPFFRSKDGVLFDVRINSLICYPAGNKLKSYNIPDGTELIGAYAISANSFLKNITIPHSVHEISDYAFRNCLNLTTLIIPFSVKHIGELAFADCNALKSITIEHELPLEIDDHVFTETVMKKATLYVPKSSLEAYEKSISWKYFRKIQVVR